MMGIDKRVVTANLPLQLAQQMDEVCRRIDRTKSWIVRQAVAEWLAAEERRHEATIVVRDEPAGAAA